VQGKELGIPSPARRGGAGARGGREREREREQSTSALCSHRDLLIRRASHTALCIIVLHAQKSLIKWLKATIT
jgi:hypothetical protein